MTDAPFNNCQFRECDLPGQCRSEGKCHHPRAAGASEGQAEPVYQIAAGKDWRDISESDYQKFSAQPDRYLVRALYLHPSAEIAALREENANWQEAGRTMASEVTRLRERIAGMEKDAERARWIDVETRAPECGEWVLATNGKWTGVAAYFTDVVDSDEHWQDERREFIEMLGPKVTHWMPLPDAPTS